MIGLDKLREHFAGHDADYTIIGGAACDLLFGEAGLPFRATKDIDMVLCVEVVNTAFAKTIIEFLEAGGYRAREKSDGDKEFFRFHKPATEGYPFMIELFARSSSALELPEDIGVARIPVEEDIISLSAILLDKDYYAALKGGRRIIDGVSILDESLLIPFKARAFLDLSARAEKGEEIDSRHIKKHRNDVFRLAQLLPANAEITLSEPIRRDFALFLENISTDTAIDPKTFNVPFSRDDIISILKRAYSL